MHALPRIPRKKAAALVHYGVGYKDDTERGGGGGAPTEHGHDAANTELVIKLETERGHAGAHIGVEEELEEVRVARGSANRAAVEVVVVGEERDDGDDAVCPSSNSLS